VGVLAASLVTWRAIDAAGQQILADPFQPAFSSEQTPGSATDKPKPHSGSSSGGHSKGNGNHSSTHTATPRTPPATPASSVTKTWRGDAGYVVAACQGSTLTLNSITPNNGYRAEIGDGSSTRASVHFEPKSDQGSEMVLLITCAAGSPQFSTQSDG
jgi:hypothetical protein